MDASSLPLDQAPSVTTLLILILLYIRERRHDRIQDDKAKNMLLKINAIETALKCLFACYVDGKSKADVAKVALEEIDRANPGISDSVLVGYIKEWAKGIIGAEATS